ncbi:MAG TPA: response regulator transcription factor [Candidatus Acidoferrales bacterium]|nr:response regulator transcription factor [Candidatus Acidoferrales bacterium]
MAIDHPNVLIVDDNPTVRAALRSFLKTRTSAQLCGEASNGVEAIQQAMEQKPALILMDLAMPEMNGVEAANVIKKSLPDTKIIMFTLFPDRVGHLMAKAAGVDLVVDKEEGTAGLVRVLQDMLVEN